MLFVYPAIFHKEGSSYWVEFPDLDGCQTYGDTVKDAMECAQEALNVYVSTLLDENLPLAAPSDIKSIQSPVDGFTSLVSCNIEPSRDTKAVKKTLTIPAWLNDRACAMNLNFSKILQDALLSKLQM